MKNENRLLSAANLMWSRKADEKFNLVGVAKIYRVNSKALQSVLINRVMRELKQRIADREQGKVSGI